MPNIADAYVNALLADASYVKTLQNGLAGAQLQQALQERMTPTLATFIAGNFVVASHIETSDGDSVPIGSGFDATVWRGKAGTVYAGKVFVSMQGTFGAADFLSDAQLALTGNAGQQVIDMINWWLETSTPTTGVATQYRYAMDPVSEFWSWSTYSVPGRGLVTSAELAAGVEVNGHSLGG